jgi:HK97 family phage prohead protease
VAVFKVPNSVAKNAQQALDWREKYPKETADAGTPVGWVRARQLANQEDISEDVINRMVSFFARHNGNQQIDDKYKDEPWKDNGYLMWLAWGGNEGRDWANRIQKTINNQNNKSFNADNMNNLQYKSFEIKAYDKLKGIITGYGSTYGNKDLVNEIVVRGALDESINAFNNGTKIVEFLYEHKKAIVLNSMVDKLENDNIGMITQATVSPSAREAYPVEWERIANYCLKNLGRMSIGYVVMDAYAIINGVKSYYVKDGIEDDDIKEVIKELKLTKYLEKIDLREVSFVGNPANTQARIFDIKSINLPTYPIDIDSSWDGAMAEKRWREYTKSTEKPTADYKKGFLYYDAQKQDNFTAYHLNIVDVVDGSPVVNAKAVSVAYAAMNGARRGLKVVPESEMPRLENTIMELYKKINRVRIQEGMDPSDMPSFKTKSEFDIALEGIKGRTDLERLFVSMKKEGKLMLSHTEIKKLSRNVYKPKKTLDNENNNINEKSEPRFDEARLSVDIADDVKSTNQPLTYEDELNEFFKS